MTTDDGCRKYRRVRTALSLFFLGYCLSGYTIPLHAEQSPTSSGPVSQLEAPVLRIPLMRKLPMVDGKFSLEEWEDSTSLTGFWSTNCRDPETRRLRRPIYEHMAPQQIQSWIYAGYDRENLFIAYVVAVYPQNAWLKALGRFPEVYNHPLYGLMRDDHVELEVRPFEELGRGYQMGMFKWFVNPLGTVADQWWSPRGGLGRSWQSGADVQTDVGPDRWTVEMRIPLKSLKAGDYAGKLKDGTDIVRLPPSDGTTYRAWFKNGIGGAGQYVVLYDQHTWNTTKTKMIFDSQAIGVQINSIGPVMDDIIDAKVKLKNHSDRSRTVRLGFFVENPAGLIYSSYEDEATKDGLVEMVPGEVKEIRLRKKFPGIAKDGNYLWFDVRQSGVPARALYRCRLTKFHAADPPSYLSTWRKDKLGSLEKMRPPKKDFWFQHQFSPYKGQLSAIVDRGIHGASDEAKRAAEAKLTVLEATEEEEVVAEKTVPFHGDFATILMDLTELKAGDYKVTLLLFDKNKRIVGERNPEAFYKGAFPGTFSWEKNDIGRNDIVWEPFTPIKVEGNVLDMFKHAVAVAPSGLPDQITIKPDNHELPLENRVESKKIDSHGLQAIGRGPQLRAPMRFEAVVNGNRIPATAAETAEAVRTWKSEVEYRSTVTLGPLEISLRSQYDCDGALTVDLTYGAENPVEVEALELVMEVAGPVDTCTAGGYGMEPSSGWGMAVPEGDGIVWDSAKDMEPMELYYSSFVPWLFFGSGDRGWTWMCDSDQGWVLDRDGSCITLERNKRGEVTMRVKLINHKASISEKRSTTFALLTHPAKAKEEHYRRISWYHRRPTNYEGTPPHAALPNDGPGGISGSDTAFEHFRKTYPNGAPRLYILKNMINAGAPAIQKRAYTGEWMLDSSRRVTSTTLDRKGPYGQPWTKGGTVHAAWGSESWEDYHVYHCARMIRLGKVTGWWWDEMHAPVRGVCVANGMAYFRDPEDVKEKELPYQSNFGSLHIRGLLKRLARVFKENNVPNYTSLWATSATSFESYVQGSWMTESAAGETKSYEIDHITRFPLRGWRFASSTCKGLTVYHGPRFGLDTDPGDNPRLDRARLGRVLAHDIGATATGNNMEHYAHVFNALADFGYFEEETTEYIPYWRSGGHVRFGEKFHGDTFDLTAEDPFAKTHVTIYRRPYKKVNGKQGYKALFVIVNEGWEPLRGRLHILNPDRVFGGTNNLLLAEAHTHRDYELPFGLGNLKPAYPYGRYLGLRDAETQGTVVKSLYKEPRQEVDAEIYGPIYVRGHDFRLLYGHYDPGLDTSKPGERYKRRATLFPRRTRPKPDTSKPLWERWRQGMPGVKSE
ncbi:MAG: DUF6067 family protein [Planctomycetota bacterium]|nr:DUF6067 family protein [Planctomycetota bacterium]